VEDLADLGEGPIQVTHLGSAHDQKLSQLKATAICGNDITSSCLYVSALCALYVRGNEQTKWLKVVHIYQDRAEIPHNLADDLRGIDRLYPELRSALITVQGKFGPELIERLSRNLNVPKNYMFIGCPGDRFPHNIAELGGVRLIL